MVPQLELKKIKAVELRSVDLDEKWLQARINDDPSLLGLGDIEVAGKEHKQPVGGRIDFLMRDSEGEIYYEVEVMLGGLDESHIIRTIEYWDIERQRRPQFEHYAVIVAERITSRFFNVLRLLNRSVPLIAIQLSAFRLDDSIVLHFVRVLDVIEETSDPGDGLEPEPANREYWEKKSDPSSLSMMDGVVSSLETDGVKPKLTYNRHHVALGTIGYNFCWFQPRKTPGRCYIQFRKPENRDGALSTLQEAGISASPRLTDIINLSLTAKVLEQHFALIMDQLKQAEEASR